jgi:hypothetical protein
MGSLLHSNISFFIYLFSTTPNRPFGVASANPGQKWGGWPPQSVFIFELSF